MRLFTDCWGDAKHTAIKGVFAHKFPEIEISFTEQVAKDGTPLTKKELDSQTKNRLLFLKTKAGFLKEVWYAATIQRGFYCSGALWHMQARVGIATPRSMALGYTSSIPIPLDVSRWKSYDKSQNIRDLVKIHYRKWDSEKTSLFSFLTEGEDEVAWFQEPLRYCLKEILRQEAKL